MLDVRLSSPHYPSSLPSVHALMRRGNTTFFPNLFNFLSKPPLAPPPSPLTPPSCCAPLRVAKRNQSLAEKESVRREVHDTLEYRRAARQVGHATDTALFAGGTGIVPCTGTVQSRWLYACTSPGMTK